jgi:Na+-driven multidrug efflux pump
MEAYTFPVIFVTAAVGRFGADAIAGYGLASRLHSSALRNA